MDYNQLQLIIIVSKNGRLKNQLLWIIIKHNLILKRDIIIEF